MTFHIQVEVYQRGKKIMHRTFVLHNEDPEHRIARTHEMLARVEGYARMEQLEREGEIWLRAFER